MLVIHWLGLVVFVGMNDEMMESAGARLQIFGLTLSQLSYRGPGCWVLARSHHNTI
jgi:hypothetical protein